MTELPGILKVVAPSLQEQAHWKLWTCWEEATAQAHTFLLPLPLPLPLDGPRTDTQPRPSTPSLCLSSR